MPINGGSQTLAFGPLPQGADAKQPRSDHLNPQRDGPEAFIVWKLTPCKGFHGFGGLSVANGENGQVNGDGDVLDRVHRIAATWPRGF